MRIFYCAGDDTGETVRLWREDWDDDLVVPYESYLEVRRTLDDAVFEEVTDGH